jgi:hypothetical protein
MTTSPLRAAQYTALGVTLSLRKNTDPDYSIVLSRGGADLHVWEAGSRLDALSQYLGLEVMLDLLEALEKLKRGAH